MQIVLATFVLLFLNVATSQTCSDAQVLILGGGMAGVSAANRLAELGITDFIILEAQDRLGGRMRTEELVPGVNVNVGANWIQGVDPAAPRLHPIFDLAERCGGLNGIYSDYDDVLTYDSQGNVVSDNDLRYDDYDDAAEDALTTLQASRGPDISAREGLTQAGWIPTSPEDNFVEWFSFDFCVGESPNVSSLLEDLDISTFSDFLADPDNDAVDYLVTDSKGYSSLIQCLANNFSTNPSTDERIHLNTVVTRIVYNEDCVCATATENGQETTYCAPYAIVTFSLGVLKEGSSTLFSPPLPEAKVNALDLAVMAFYGVIYAEFDERFWDTGYEYIGHVSPNRGYFPLILVLPQSFGATIVFHVTDDEALRLATLSEDTLKTEIFQVLRSIYGDNATEPNRVLMMPWATDPHFLGSFSNTRPGGQVANAELQVPEGRMYLAGEGTSVEYSGFVHGAYLSGIDTANTINGIIISSESKLVSNSALLLVAAAAAWLLLVL